MYHIAICDTDDISLQEMIHLLRNLFEQSNIEVSFDSYCTREDLTCFISSNPFFYDLLLFYVIDQEGENDFHIIRRLQALHMKARMILIASTDRYVFDGYDVGAYHYLLKPFDPSKLHQLLLKDYHQNYLSEKVAIPSGIGFIQLTPKDIVYLEVINKTIHIRYWNDDDYFQGKLNTIKEVFCQYHFLQSHRSYLINSDYIKKFSRTQIVMANGDSVPVSKYRYKDLLEQFPLNLKNTK